VEKNIGHAWLDISSHHCNKMRFCTTFDILQGWSTWAYSSPWLFEANKHDFWLKKQKLQLQVHMHGWTLLQATRVLFMNKKNSLCKKVASWTFSCKQCSFSKNELLSTNQQMWKKQNNLASNLFNSLHLSPIEFICCS